MPLPVSKVNIFIAFSPADTSFKDELEEHLTVLQRQGIINVWHNQKIEAGENLNEKQNEALQNAQIILLLISSDFLSSDYAYENEVLKALERHKQGLARVIPVILRDCLWKTGALGQLAPLPLGGLPVTEWDNPDSAFKNIATEIQKMVARFTIKDGTWVYTQSNSKTQQSGINKWVAAIIGIVAIAFGIFAGISYQNRATETKLEDDKKTLLNNLQGDWVNPKNDDTFIHRLQFRNNYVGVYSLGQAEEIYWGEQEVEVINNRKCKIAYEGLSFDLEVVNTNILDTLVESLIAIYRIDSPAGIMGLRNSKLLREKTLQLLAMRNDHKSTSRTDTAGFVLKTEKVVNLKDLNLTPRMILDVSTIATDTTQTRIKTDMVSKAIEQRFINLQPPDTVKTNHAPAVKDGIHATSLNSAHSKVTNTNSTKPAIGNTSKAGVLDSAALQKNRADKIIRVK